jgi:hypothetical protein
LKSYDVTKHIIFHISKTFYNNSKIIVLSKLKIKKNITNASSKYHIKNFEFPKKIKNPTIFIFFTLHLQKSKPCLFSRISPHSLNHHFLHRFNHHLFLISSLLSHVNPSTINYFTYSNPQSHHHTPTHLFSLISIVNF